MKIVIYEEGTIVLIKYPNNQVVVATINKSLVDSSKTTGSWFIIAKATDSCTLLHIVI